MARIYIIIFLSIGLILNVQGKPLKLYSPDGKLCATIELGAELSYSLSYQGKVYLLPSRIGMRFADGRMLGERPVLSSRKTTTVNRVLRPLYGTSASLEEAYAELVLEFKGGYSVAFRAYDRGFAYRFVSGLAGEVKVESEKAEFRFQGNPVLYLHPELSESNYLALPLANVKPSSYSSLPLLATAEDGIKMMIHESDVFDYPCMDLSVKGEGLLAGIHAKVPSKVAPGGHMNFNLKVQQTEDFIARTSGSRSFPWRLIAFEKTDQGLLDNHLVYLLNRESLIGDGSWIRPGKVAWDWWNALNLSGVDFKTGFNTATYKYFIDFAAKNGIEYVNLDEGWSDQFDLMSITDKLDMPEVIRYAKEKKVGIILWCVWYTLDRQMIAALDQFERWGISGVKVDFMDRDDQLVVNFQERLLREAAARKMLVSYHGAYHPNGMERAYPNYITTEGVKGLEWNKFDSAGVSPDHDVTIPFIRMFAGAMDYTPGAMANYNKTDWKQIFDRPMSQGTRCHQLAMYTVYYGPLQMLADAPTTYEREPEYLRYLASVPTVWDQTVPLESKVGEYVTIARRKGADWFLASMSGWTARTLSVKLDFLEQGKKYWAEIFADGPNAEKVGSDYQRVIKEVKAGDVLQINMAPGGGWSARFSLVKD